MHNWTPPRPEAAQPLEGLSSKVVVKPAVNERVDGAGRHGDEMTDKNCSRIVSHDGEMCEQVVNVDGGPGYGKK